MNIVGGANAPVIITLQEKREQRDGAIKRAPVKARIVENVENVMKIWPLMFASCIHLKNVKVPLSDLFFNPLLLLTSPQPNIPTSLQYFEFCFWIFTVSTEVFNAQIENVHTNRWVESHLMTG